MSRLFRCGTLVTLAALLIIGYRLVLAADNVSSNGVKSADSDPFRVPDGSIEELQKYIEGLRNLPPPSSLRPAGVEFRRRRAAAQLAASEKILAARPLPEQVRAALRAKIAGLTMLERLGDTAATAGIEATVQQAERLTPLPPPPAEAPPPTVIAPPTLLPPNAPVQGPPHLVRDVKLAILQGRAQHVETMNGPLYARLVEGLVDYLKNESLDGDDARLAADVAMAGEACRGRVTAAATYAELGAILATREDPKILSTAATLLGAARRLDLVGKPIVLQGATLGGKSIDPTKYKGKIVLVDFFATWCGPCREEIPNIARCYRAYRKRGFEVVGVSLDRDRKAIADFLDKEKYPWTVLLDSYESRGTDKSMATYYGIFTIPQMVLVGRDGRVLSIDVRGQRLNRALAEQLGPASTEHIKNRKEGTSPDGKGRL